jgi:hypothetical protein
MVVYVSSVCATTVNFPIQSYQLSSLLVLPTCPMVSSCLWGFIGFCFFRVKVSLLDLCVCPFHIHTLLTTCLMFICCSFYLPVGFRWVVFVWRYSWSDETVKLLIRWGIVKRRIWTPENNSSTLAYFSAKLLIMDFVYFLHPQKLLNFF